MNNISIPLWVAKSKEDKEYYRSIKNGILIDGKKYSVRMFENKEKKGEKSPDYNVLLTEIKEEVKETVNEFDIVDAKKDIELTDEDLPF